MTSVKKKFIKKVKNFTLNFEPQHPATHGVIRVLLFTSCFIIKLVTIGLAGYIIMPKFELLVKYCSEFQEVFMFVVFFEFVDLFFNFCICYFIFYDFLGKFYKHCNVRTL